MTVRAPSLPPPVYLRESSDRYRYLRLLWEGETYEQARLGVGATERQTRRWREELRRSVGVVLDRDVTFAFALRYAFDIAKVGGQFAR